MILGAAGVMITPPRPASAPPAGTVNRTHATSSDRNQIPINFEEPGMSALSCRRAGAVFVWLAQSKRVLAPSLSRGPLGERPLPGRARARRTGSGVAAGVAWGSARLTPRDTAPAHWRGCARAH